MILALLAGAVVGIALGALGGGGSVLAVPALIYLLGFSPVTATTASLVVVALTSVTALYAHARDGRVRWRTGALFAVAGLIPAALGGVLAARLPDAVLTGAFAVIAAVVAIGMLRSDDGRDERDDRDEKASGADSDSGSVRGGEGVERAGGTGPAVRAGAGVGALTGVLGVGGGFLVVPALIRTLGLGTRTAVGTGLLVITVNAIAALATRSGTAQGLEWGLIAPFAAAAVLGAWDGKRLADRLPAATLRRILAWVLIAVAVAMATDATGVV